MDKCTYQERTVAGDLVEGADEVRLACSTKCYARAMSRRHPFGPHQSPRHSHMLVVFLSITTMEYYATNEDRARAAREAYVRECSPPPDVYLLPPYQATPDSFLTRSSLLSPPPLQMRCYGMPEYLWHCFEDWLAAPVVVRPLLVNRAAVGFRLRWPRRPVGRLSPQQDAWVKSRQWSAPQTMHEVCPHLLIAMTVG